MEIKSIKIFTYKFTVYRAPYGKYSDDSSVKVDTPAVSDTSLKIYEDYKKIGTEGPTQPSELDRAIYKSYVEQRYM